MLKIDEVIVVEGKYDRNTLSQVVDAAIVETRGFGVFKDGETLELLRKLAEKRGIVVLTDGDSAGFLIRNYLKSAIGTGKVLHAYIPDIPGKERRKRAASKEGKLGVEGMDADALTEALRRAGAHFSDGGPGIRKGARFTKANLYSDGLCGGPGSAGRRKELLRRLGLPERLSSNGLLDVLNAAYSPEEYREAVRLLGAPE